MENLNNSSDKEYIARILQDLKENPSEQKIRQSMKELKKFTIVDEHGILKLNEVDVWKYQSLKECE